MSTLEAELLKSIGTASYTNQILNSTVAVSSSGDVYISGSFFGTLDIGGGVTPITTNSDNYSSFIARYNSSLTPTLLKYIGGTSKSDNSLSGSLGISSSGDVYVTGSFEGTLDIGGVVTPITTITDGCGFVAKYTSSLTPITLKRLVSTNPTDNCICISVAVSQNDDVYISGSFKGTLDIGGGVTPINTISTFHSGFIAKYTSSLTPTSLRGLGSTNPADNCICNSVAVSQSGDVYISGSFKGTLDIGNGVTPINTTSTFHSGFIAKYTSSLTANTLQKLDGTASRDTSAGISLAVSQSGDVYISGSFIGTLDISGGVTPINTDSTTSSGFVAKYTSSLTPNTLKLLGGIASTDNCICNYLAVSQSGDVYISGSFKGTLDIDGGVTPITTSSNQGGFMAKYSSTLSHSSINYLGGTSAKDFYIGGSLAISSSDDVYVSSSFFGTLDIGGGVPPIINTCPCVEPICLVSGTPIRTDQGIVAIDNIDTTIHTIGNKRIVAVTKAITPEKNLICFEPHSITINCPTKRTVMTPGHEVLYKGKLVQAKHFVGTINGVHTVPYDGKVVYNVLLQQHGVMSVNNMIVETLHPENKVAKRILNTF
jgi:hypothetical protein